MPWVGPWRSLGFASVCGLAPCAWLWQAQRMLWRLRQYISCALVALGCCNSAPMKDRLPPSSSDPGCRPTGVSAGVARVLAAALDKAVAANRGYGAGVLRIDRVGCGTLWAGSSGRISREAATPMRVDDAFEIASISKTFTAALVLQLVEENAIVLDAPAVQLAPDVFEKLLVVDGRDRSSEITVRQLLGHMAGLPDYWTDPPFVTNDENAFLQAFLTTPDRRWEPRELVSYARALRPVGRPGEQYHYSDTGYVILGLIIERVTGKPFHEALRERILTRLDLNETFLSYHESPPTLKRAAARYEGQLDVSDQLRQSADWAGGGLVSTARDLVRFAAGLTRGGFFHEPSTWKAMTNWHSTHSEDVDYGLGLFRIALETRAGQLWGHDGHGNAFMYYWPERELVFTGTLNQTQNDWWPLVSAAIKAIKDAG